MGGLCSPLIMQRRLSNSVLRCIPEWRAVSLDETAFLINIHKFIALIINSLFVIMYFTNLHCQCSTILPNLNGWIFLLEADKTSALSWISRLSCMQNITLWTSATSSLILYYNLTLGFHLNSTAGKNIRKFKRGGRRSLSPPGSPYIRENIPALPEDGIPSSLSHTTDAYLRNEYLIIKNLDEGNLVRRIGHQRPYYRHPTTYTYVMNLRLLRSWYIPRQKSQESPKTWRQVYSELTEGGGLSHNQ